MVDIESLGTEPGAAILIVGAVTFDTDGVDEDAGFYGEANLKSNEAAGLYIDADTLEWWLGQDDEAKTVLTGGGDLAGTLEMFADYVEHADVDEVWANSPSFDCRLLGAALDAVDVGVPWEYYHERDYRTLKSLPAFEDPGFDDGEVAHDAFDDAVVQARAASATLSALEKA
jgi:hypothetical protein